MASVQPVTGSPLVSAVTATDGTFTLTNMPVGTNIPLVIQIGKWRRQVVIPTVTACTNTAVPAALSHLPTSHAQGDIPKIAIVTGASDAIECVLQKVGIAQSEFTDPSGSGRVNFYQGDGSSSSTGAEIDSSTPTEATLEASQSAMNAYDAVMFGCQGGAYTESNTALGYLANFANAGGRVFATHYEYVWLNTNAGFQSTVDWAVGGPDPTPDPGTGVINQNQSFPKGIQLASWLTDVGASSTPGEITISTLRNDQTGAISPTASWMTDGSDIMQFTFNTPVGVASDQQCGRVLFNEYHVEDTSGTTTKGMKFPAECSTGAMTAQEKLLEYSLFDLMNALTSDVPPTATISVSNSPSAFVQGDSADNVTINVTDTTSTIATNPSLSVTAVLPTGLAPYSMEGTNANTGWLCTAATLTCTRTTGLNGGASDPITLMVTVASNAPITSGATISAMVSGGGLAASVSGQDSVPIKGLPLITWNTPAAITYGTALGAAQLNATSGGVAGTFVYTPAAGTVPRAGSQTLSVTFTPTDSTDYVPVTTTVTLLVNKATPTITWGNPAAINYGTTLSGTQLNATASVPGTFAYTPAAGSTPATGSDTLSVTFTPTDTTDYSNQSATVTLLVNKATPTITWGNPAAINYGTTLSGTQLNATASVPGTFAYTPAAGSTPATGSDTLSVTFTPTDTTDYSNQGATVTLLVNKATPTITWGNPAAINYGTTLSGTQLNATASVPGTFAYTPAAGSTPATGSDTLSVTFTPTDTTDYSNQSATVTLLVNKATPTITWGNPAAINYGTTLSGTQLNATASVPGTFAYTPAAGSTPATGSDTLSVTFTPTDTTDYSNQSATVTLLVNKATPTITWGNPAAINYGTTLSGTQLNATASVPGTFAYTPAAGSTPATGSDTLSVTFTPTDTTDYSNQSATVTLLVNKATPTIMWGIRRRSTTARR